MRIILIALSMLCGCTSMLPMTENVSGMSHDEAVRIAMITHLTEEQVKDPTIHEVHEVRLSFAQMLEECAPGVRWWMWAIGSLPLACTKIIQQPWNEKVAIIYHGWYTDPFTMAHEREHAKGNTHQYW